MTICAIIAEYNPFTNGHKYHIDQTRLLLSKKCKDDVAIIAVMSGNFVQRGDVAIQSKFERAELAVKNGVDLVVELPPAFSLGCAETFARGGIKIAELLGAKYLSFGSECGDENLIDDAAAAAVSAIHTETFKRYCRGGLAYPDALSKTISESYVDEIAEVFTRKDNPNDILGVEYIKAIDFLGSFIKPLAIKRIGDGHNSKIDSATAVRKKILSADNSEKDALKQLLPYEFNYNSADIKRLEIAILAKLRCMNPKEISVVPEVYHGLENRIFSAVKVARSLNELYTLTATKCFLNARVRRVILSAFLNIKKSDEKSLPEFARVLAMNPRGKGVLSGCENSGKTSTSLKKLAGLSNKSRRQAFLMSSSTDMFNLALECPKRSKTDYTDKPYMI